MGTKSNAAKVSISVAEPELLAWVKKRAARTGKSLSAVFTDAVRLERQMEARGRVLEWMGPEAVPSSEEARALVAEWAGDAPSSPPRRKRKVTRSRGA